MLVVDICARMAVCEALGHTKGPHTQGDIRVFEGFFSNHPLHDWLILLVVDYKFYTKLLNAIIVLLFDNLKIIF